MSCSELHWLCWGELECRGNVVWSEKCFQKLGACLIYPCASSHTELPAACGSNKITCPRQFHTNTPFGPSFFLALVPILLKTVPLWFLILELWGLQLILLLETYQFAYLVLYLIGKSVLLDLKPFHSVGPNRTLCKRRIKLYGTHSIWTCMNCETQPSSIHWLSSPIFPCSSFVVRRLFVRPASVTSPFISTIWCSRPYKPYIFC